MEQINQKLPKNIYKSVDLQFFIHHNPWEETLLESRLEVVMMNTPTLVAFVWIIGRDV